MSPFPSTSVSIMYSFVLLHSKLPASKNRQKICFFLFAALMIARTLRHFQSLFSLACFQQQPLVAGQDYLDHKLLKRKVSSSCQAQKEHPDSRHKSRVTASPLYQALVLWTHIRPRASKALWSPSSARGGQTIWANC